MRLDIGEWQIRSGYTARFLNEPGFPRVLEKAGYQYKGRLRKSVTKDGNLIGQLLYAVVRGP